MRRNRTFNWIQWGIFGSVLGCFLVTSSWADLTSKGKIAVESRFFNEDSRPTTLDSNLALASEVEADFSQDLWMSKLRLFGRSDQVDETRNVVMIEEAYVGRILGPLDLKAGYQLINWTAMEAFHPVDSINSRNFDSNIENLEKFGEPMLNATLLMDTGSVTFLVMPNFVEPKYPNSTNRLAPNSGVNLPLGAPILVNSQGHVTTGQTFFQWAIRADQTIGNADVSLHVLDHIDRTNPVVVVDGSQVRFAYLPKRQYGGTIQYIIGDFILKSEIAVNTFQKVVDTAYGRIQQDDYTQLAFGLEYLIGHDSGSESTVLMELQTIDGHTAAERSALSLFQRDLLLGYRFVRNDIEDTQFLALLILDLERESEYLVSLGVSRRLTDVWGLDVGIRMYQASVKGSTVDGLELLRDADHLYATLTRYF